MSEAERKGAHDPKNSLCVVGAEALFLALPFVVIALVLFERGELAKFAYMPEWAIAASVLIGLSLVRFAAGLLQARVRVESLAWERVMLMFALIIIFGLIPSLLVLSLVLVSPPSLYLALAQIGLFAFGLFLFLSLGWTAQHLLTEDRTADQDPKRDFTVIATARAAGE